MKGFVKVEVAFTMLAYRCVVEPQNAYPFFGKVRPCIFSTKNPGQHHVLVVFLRYLTTAVKVCLEYHQEVPIFLLACSPVERPTTEDRSIPNSFNHSTVLLGLSSVQSPFLKDRQTMLTVI